LRATIFIKEFYDDDGCGVTLHSNYLEWPK